jgi:hypothetical protein
MAHRIKPQDEKRLRREHDSRRERLEHELARDRDVPVGLAVSSLSERTLCGMRREITARLVAIQLGGEEGRRLGALSRAVRAELARRQAGGEPRRAA